MPIATATVGPADPNRKPNNPNYLRAEELIAAGDKVGLQALDATLAAEGYSPTGQVRSLIAAALEG